MVFNAIFNNISVISWWSFLFVEEINVREHQRDNPEKLTTQITQDQEKQNKNPTQCVLDTTIYANIHKQLINKT